MSVSSVIRYSDGQLCNPVFRSPLSHAVWPSSPLQNIMGIRIPVLSSISMVIRSLVPECSGFGTACINWTKTGLVFRLQYINQFIQHKSYRTRSSLAFRCFLTFDTQFWIPTVICFHYYKTKKYNLKMFAFKREFKGTQTNTRDLLLQELKQVYKSCTITLLHQHLVQDEKLLF